MALSRLAQQFADEIRNHDWSDAPWRADRAGHDRETDTNRKAQVLDPHEIWNLKMNVMWVTAQVLAYNDPNFDVYEFAEACGLDTRTRSGRPRSGGILYGLRWDTDEEGIRHFHRPGTFESDADVPEPDKGDIED